MKVPLGEFQDCCGFEAERVEPANISSALMVMGIGENEMMKKKMSSNIFNDGNFINSLSLPLSLLSSA